MIDLFEIGCLSVKIKAEHLADDATKLFHSSPKISWSVCPLETISTWSYIWTKDGACPSKVTDSYVLNCNIRIVPKCLKSKNALAYLFDNDEGIRFDYEASEAYPYRASVMKTAVSSIDYKTWQYARLGVKY